MGCRAVRLGARAGADRRWNEGDSDRDGVFDAGLVFIGETDYRLMLRYAEFDPVGLSRAGGGRFDPAREPYAVGEPPIPDGLRAADVPGGCRVYLVQLWTHSVPEFVDSIVALGGVVRSSMPDNAYLVEMTAPVAEQVGALACVRWVGHFQPAYRLDEQLTREYFAGGAGAPPPPRRRYNVKVLERGMRQKQAVADRIEAMGGVVEAMPASGFLLEATLDGEQLRAVLCMNEVNFVDRWAPPQTTMDNARILSGAVYLENLSPLGFTGAGVRGEVMDTGFYRGISDSLPHPDFQNPLPIYHPDLCLLPPLFECPALYVSHGTSTYGIVFGNPLSGGLARGMLPSGQGIFAEWGPPDRYAHTKDLVDVYRAVFQSNSWTNLYISSYTNISAEMDDIAFATDILICQSQGKRRRRRRRNRFFGTGLG